MSKIKGVHVAVYPSISPLQDNNLRKVMLYTTIYLERICPFLDLIANICQYFYFCSTLV